MQKIIILVSGMAGTGKSTFSKWLSAELFIPLVCYDNIMKKMMELAESKYDNPNIYPPIVRDIPNEFLWFNIEEIMKSSSPLIVDYFLCEMHRTVIHALVLKYLYKVIHVQFDSESDVAYRRFVERNEKDAREQSIRKSNLEMDLKRFTELTKPNKDFRYNDSFIYVNTNDFENVSYENILEQLQKQMLLTV